MNKPFGDGWKRLVCNNLQPISAYQAEQWAIRDHHVTHKHENGLFWSECKCGWASKPRDSHDNYQVTGSLKDGNQHQNQMIGIARNHALGFIKIT